MCYCRPEIRTPFCGNCTGKMFTDIQNLKAELEFYKALHDAGAYRRLAAAAKERLDEYVTIYEALRRVR